MKDKLCNEPDKIRHLQIGKTNYIINTFYCERGKSIDEVVEDFIVSKAKEKIA